jgi:hypothetical protein
MEVIMHNQAKYLQSILDNPNTSTQDYLRAERELQAMQAQQNYLNNIRYKKCGEVGCSFCDEENSDAQ